MKHGTTVLVVGPNDSGKSAFAEKLAAKLCAQPEGNAAGTLYYIATMDPYGEEGQARIEKHRMQREPFGFITIEERSCVSGIPFPREAVVLLEDVSNLLGNALFGGSRNGSEDSVFEDIAALCAKCRAAVLVSIGELAGGQGYDGETHGYIDKLNRLNQRLLDFADAAVSMRDGKPSVIKGDGYALD